MHTPYVGLDNETKRYFRDPLDELVHEVPFIDKAFVGGYLNRHVRNDKVFVGGYLNTHL